MTRAARGSTHMMCKILHKTAHPSFRAFAELLLDKVVRDVALAGRLLGWLCRDDRCER